MTCRLINLLIVGSYHEYGPLGDFLRSQRLQTIRLSLKEIEKIIAAPLPDSANTPQFWANVARHSPSRRHQWMGAGYSAFFEPTSTSVRFERTFDTEPATSTRIGNRWSTAELRACVEAYRRLLDAEEEGVVLSKAKVRAHALENGLAGRTHGAYEYRMQNISAVLVELGLPVLGGYKPLVNIGSSKATLVELIDEVWTHHDDATTPTDDIELFQSRSSMLTEKYAEGDFPPPKGKQTVTVSTGEVRMFVRDPKVAGWVRANAEGRCEACCANAPFRRDDGVPYLEVHHLRPLAEGGPDATDNAIAICPNCHRELHSGSGRESFRASLLQRIGRLCDYPLKKI